MGPSLGRLRPEMETSGRQWPWPRLYLACPPKTERERQMGTTGEQQGGDKRGVKGGKAQKVDKDREKYM